MGGAQRNQRKQKQRSHTQATRAVASARGGSGNAKWIAAIVAVVVIAVVIIGGVLIANNNKQAKTNDSIAAVKPGVSYAIKPHNGVITAGKKNAKAELDFYEDYLCPGCGQLNKQYGSEIDKALQSGDVKVNYHMLPFLDQMSNPPGYSTRSAAAAYAVAVNDPQKWAAYEHSLFKSQPGENSSGYTNDQLISLGKRLGVGGSFAKDVKSGKYKDTIKQVGKKGAKAIAKASGSQPSTPTVVQDGKKLQTSPGWVQKAIKKGKG